MSFSLWCSIFLAGWLLIGPTVPTGDVHARAPQCAPALQLNFTPQQAGKHSWPSANQQRPATDKMTRAMLSNRLAGEPWLTAAIPTANPCYSCKLQSLWISPTAAVS